MSESLKNEMCAYARSLHALGLAPRFGLAAARLDGAHVLIGTNEAAFCELSLPDIAQYGTHEDGAFADILRIFAARSDIFGLFLLDSPFSRQASEAGAVMLASLDDTAQIAGGRIRTAASQRASDTLPCIRKNFGCFVKGFGQLTVGRSLHEAYVAALVLEKGARAQIQGAAFGGAKPLSGLDRLLMRTVYLKKYSQIQEHKL